ncbi:hypothetical protein E8P82_09785 [Arthrobacter echini]|uniref:DUF305 domain-containing protein n=1 Tax=Arthrobacter echini TaxID=1529066 RepID=A0A4S5E4D9_9MICC|nr:hypothetical protein [Arthrobacter echini]THJ66273.1 hypothetical protein E8P82_09785 [Arthrobacter echini]
MTPDTERTPAARFDPSTLYPYLDLHLMGASNGIRLFDAAHSSWTGTQYEADFGRLRMTVREERAMLKRLIKALGHRPSLPKQSLARVMALVSARNPLNPRRRTASGGAQLELESLLSVLKGKEALWLTLLAVPLEDWARAGEGVPGHAAIERSLADCRGQQELVAGIMTATAADRFRRR